MDPPTSSLEHRFMDRSLAHPADPSLPRPEGLNPKRSELSPVGNQCMFIDAENGMKMAWKMFMIPHWRCLFHHIMRKIMFLMFHTRLLFSGDDVRNRGKVSEQIWLGCCEGQRVGYIPRAFFCVLSFTRTRRIFTGNQE